VKGASERTPSQREEAALATDALGWPTLAESKGAGAPLNSLLCLPVTVGHVPL
jgi:hypothetical protein